MRITCRPKLLNNKNKQVESLDIYLRFKNRKIYLKKYIETIYLNNNKNKYNKNKIN